MNYLDLSKSGEILPIRMGDLQQCKGEEIIICNSQEMLPVNMHKQDSLCLYGLLTKTQQQLQNHLVQNCKFSILQEQELRLNEIIKVIQNYVIFLNEKKLEVRREILPRFAKQQ